MRVDVSSWEFHNVSKRGARLRSRGGMQSVKTPTATCAFVASFSCKSPQTGEITHYLFEQDAQGVVTARMFTEEWLELYSYGLGLIDRDPVVTWAVQNNQGMIGSPSFSAPAYFYVGGGMIQFRKAPSIQPDTVALEPPRGHVASFGDRFIVSQGPVWYANDPGTNPRTFVAQNGVSLPGDILDHFQGGNGGPHLFFTTDGVYSLPVDALGQGQSVIGFLSKVAGLETVRPRNAAMSRDVVAVLQKDSIVTLDGAELVPGGFIGRRYYSSEVGVDDFRRVGELYPTPRGFICGFRKSRGFFIDIDLVEGFTSYVTVAGTDLNVVGTLRSRDGDPLIVLSDRVLMPVGNADWTGTIRAVACGRVKPKGPVLRRVTVASANAGEASMVSVNGTPSSKTVPLKSDETLIGTTLWSSTAKMRGRELRTVRHSFAERALEAGVEVAVDGGLRPFDAGIDVEASGQGANRRDKS